MALIEDCVALYALEFSGDESRTSLRRESKVLIIILITSTASKDITILFTFTITIIF